jgi:hypothetical protein
MRFVRLIEFLQPALLQSDGVARYALCSRFDPLDFLNTRD